MRFGKQRFLISLGILLLPFVFVVALTNNPQVSTYALKIALKIARIRTGINVDASSWSVNPLSFSAQLRDVVYQEADFVAQVPSLNVQVSPLGLFLFRFHVYRIDVENAKFSGSLPAEWLKSRNDSDDWRKDIPVYLGNSLKQVYVDLLKNNIQIEQFHLNAASSDLKEVKFLRADIKAQILKDGQGRAEWDINGLEIPEKLSRVHSIEGSLALLKESRKSFFLSLRRLNVRLSDIEGNTLSATGRMPGNLAFDGTIFLNDLNAWLKGGKLSQEYSRNTPVSGELKLQVKSRLANTGLKELNGSFSGSNLLFDGYRAQSLKGEIVSANDGGYSLNDIQITFPRSKLDPVKAKNLIVIKSVSIKDKKISGEFDTDKLGICALLDSLTVEECWIAFEFSGNAKFQGSLSPFLVGLEAKFQTSAGRVGSDPLLTASGDELLFTKPAELQVGADIGPSQLDIRKASIKWSPTSVANVTGRVVYIPSVVDLDVDSQSLEISDAIDSFINLNVSGKVKTRTKIFYSFLIPKEKGRTTVLSNVMAQNLGIENQILGNASGNVNFQNTQLFIGPLELRSGGGKATVVGGIKPNIKFGSEMELNIDATRLELKATLPSSQNPFLTGLLSGRTKLQGWLNPARGGGKFLGGAINATVDNVVLFNIPLQKGKIKARYEDKILHFDEIIAEKDKKNVYISGLLHPERGSRIDFKSDSVFVKNIGYMPEIERIFIDSQTQLAGFWSPQEGWEVKGDVTSGRVAHATIPAGKFSASGQGDIMEITADFSPILFYYLRAKPTAQNLSPQEMRMKAQDQGILAGMAYLKGWTTGSDVNTSGKIDFHWTPQRGHLFVDSLGVKGPNGFDNIYQDIINVTSPLRVAWEGNQVTQNSGWKQESLPVVITGSPGDKALKVKAKLPMVLFDSLIPGSQKIYTGTAVAEAIVPISPYITSVKGKGSLQDVGLQLPGVGRPLQELNGNFILTESRFVIGQGKAKMGSGAIDFRAEYLIDLKKPGVVLDATLNRAQILVQEDIPMEVSGDLSMRGDSFPYLLSGRMLISNGLYSREFNQPAATPVTLNRSEKVKTVLNYNLDLEIGSNFEIKNSILVAPLTGRLVMMGNDVTPLLSGYFDVNKGIVLAKDNEFQVSQARVQLPNEPGQPAQIFLRAFTNIKHLNQVYRIEMNVRGPSNNLAFEFTSDPPLPNGDIVNLLAFGTLRDSGESTISNKNSVETAQYEALQALFGQAIGRSINRNTGFDVRVSSSRDLSQKSTIPKVTVQRRLSKNITATFGRSLDASKPERNFQVDYRVLNNVNVTGVWESPSPEKSSTGVDLRFKFDVK